ncbi:uncharacterized protein LOC110975671 [Acanthaster planci]|uniref:Uncharacterized protein LOC110975671 n=1 Tax=Acanthaster planci TaxID=133434 RepID=A0A8B7XT51_ACAPL|nr:uncharacterized protein LOC110975671 [Acanthaster planci]XP_022084038.1 uncharacterized protein LOC110975671 [Acanthaster planci]XP_022084039.1 uncharacterized protein LOC110975671 [Acanthaster planci]XP_022084040.1 uncharacterized protein LOC110975671 [Acanthaster planci]
MTIILRMQQLPWSATSMDIRRYFTGLSIPDGGVHIVGGEDGDVFIAFSSDEDARRAMQTQNKPLCGNKIALMLSSKNEMQEVIARNRAMSQLKSDPFQQDSPNQSPVPSNQSMETPGNVSLNLNRDYSGFKDPAKSLPSNDQFQRKGQNQPVLPNEDVRVPGRPPQRPGGDKSLLGIPPYDSHRLEPAHNRQPLGFTPDHFSGRRDEIYQDKTREGEPENRPLLDVRHQLDIRSGHDPHNVGPFDVGKERQFGDQSMGHSFRNRDEFPKDPLGHVTSDRDSRIPSGRRPPLLEHEPGRPDGRPPFEPYSGRREGLLDDPQRKRLNRGQEQGQASSFEKGSMRPEEKFGKPNVPGRFDEGKHWDRPYGESKPGFPDDLKDSRLPSNTGPGATKPLADNRGNERGPIRRSRFEPESHWNQRRAEMDIEKGKFPGDPFGLNERIDDPRRPRASRDLSSERGGLDVGQRGPVEQMGPEDYRKRDEPFNANNRARIQHMDDPVHVGDQRGPGEQRGPRDEHRGRDHIGFDEVRGPREHRRPGDRIGPDRQGRSGEQRFPGHLGPEESRFLGEKISPDGPFDSSFHPDNRMGPGDGAGSGVRRGPDGRGGAGPRDHASPGDHFGPGEHMGPVRHIGPRDRRGPDDHSDPFGPGDRFGSSNRFGPGDRLNLDDPMGEHMDPRDSTGLADRRGPGGRIDDQFDPSSHFGMGDDFGPDDRMGPDGKKSINSRFGPERRFGPPASLHPEDDMEPPDMRNFRDPLDHRGLEDHPNDRFGSRGRMGQAGDQWEQRDKRRPSLLGDKGLPVENRLGRRSSTDFGPDDGMRPDGRFGPGAMGRRDPLIPERPHRDQQDPTSRKAPGNYLESREELSFLQESRFGPGGQRIHVPEELLERDSDMRRRSTAAHLEVTRGSPLLDSIPLKHSDSRKKSGAAGFVRITGMPFNVTATDIFDFVGGLTIADNGIRLTLDSARNKPNGNGYIKFASEEEATKACKLNMKYMGKRYIEVKLCRKIDWDSSETHTVPPPGYPSDVGKRSRRSRSRSPIRSTCVELRGLPNNVDSYHIKDFFHGCDITNDKIFIAQGGDNSPTGIGYVEFPDQSTLERALRKNEHSIGRHMIEVKTILKEVMNVRIIENKKRTQDRQASSKSSSAKDLGNSRDSNSRNAGSRGSSSRDSKSSGSRDRSARESSSRSSKDRDSRQPSRHGRDSQRTSDRESRPRESDSRQSVSKSRDPSKDGSSRSSDSQSRFAGESIPQKRDSESDNRRSGPGSKASPKDTETKPQESASKDVSSRSQQDLQAQPNRKEQLSQSASSRGLVKEKLDSVFKQQVQNPKALEETRPSSLDEKSCINLRNMPYNTSDEEIHNFFQEMELQPLMVHFLITPDGRPNGQAYVEMANAADAHKAVSHTNARIQDRNIIMNVITKGHMKNCLAQGKPPPQGPGLLGIPRGPPFPRAPGSHPTMDFRPPLLGSKAPPFAMRSTSGPMRGPRPPPVEVLIARGCVVEASNLPFDIPIPAIIDFFGDHNVVPESVRLKTNEHGRFCGEAMVAFRSADDAGRAIADLNKSILGGRVVRLHLMQPL